MAMFLDQVPADLCVKIFIYASSKILISLKLNNYGLDVILSLHFPEGTEENYAIFQSRLPVSRTVLFGTTVFFHPTIP
jgi:hypothetical protein